jgi:hypothetical protein
MNRLSGLDQKTQEPMDVNYKDYIGIGPVFEEAKDLKLPGRHNRPDGGKTGVRAHDRSPPSQ